MAQSLVKEGQSIQRGDQLGHVGMTGRTTGPHLHYEVRIDGGAKNPEIFLALAARLIEVL